MRAPTKTLACGVVLAAAAPWLPGWAAAVGLDVWNLPGLVAGYKDHRRAGQELDRASAVLFQVMAAKEVILADLRAGRISLATATEVYYQMVVACPRVLSGLRAEFPAAESDLERTALRLTVHGATRTDLTAGPDDPKARLAAEYRQQFPSRGLPPALTAGG